MTLGNICAKCELNPSSIYREIDWTMSFVNIFCLISDTDTALVMLTWGTQLPTLGNIYAKFKQNRMSSYREMNWTNTFVYIFSCIPNTDTGLMILT